MPKGPYRRYYSRRDKMQTALAQAIRQARRDALLTQEQLAGRLGMQRSHLAQIETGKKEIPEWRWKAFVRELPALTVLDVQARWLGGTGRVITTADGFGTSARY